MLTTAIHYYDIYADRLKWIDHDTKPSCGLNNVNKCIESFVSIQRRNLFPVSGELQKRITQINEIYHERKATITSPESLRILSQAIQSLHNYIKGQQLVDASKSNDVNGVDCALSRLKESSWKKNVKKIGHWRKTALQAALSSGSMNVVRYLCPQA